MKKKINRKNIIFSIILLVIVIIVAFFCASSTKNVEKIFNNIEKSLANREFGQGLVLVKNRKFLLVNENNKKEYFGSTKTLGLVNGYVHVSDNGKVKLNVFINGWCYSKNYLDKKIKRNFMTCPKETNFEAVNGEQVYVVPRYGKYKIELWGSASGRVIYGSRIVESGDKNTYIDENGKGAYVKGEIELKYGDILYVYVGSKGKDGEEVIDYSRFSAFGFPSNGGAGGYNGGGDAYDDVHNNAGSGGGGATDIRLIGGNWDNFESLKSRIMVAGAGGGMSRYHKEGYALYVGSGAGGDAGTLRGENAKTFNDLAGIYGAGSTQTKGYALGKGQQGVWCPPSLNGLAGGAGGYLGTYTGECRDQDFFPPTGAGGASSYVSGCKGCNSIDKNSTENNLKFTGNSKHYSKKVFENIVMKSGSEKMPNPKGGTMKGNNNDGYAKITLVD